MKKILLLSSIIFSSICFGQDFRTRELPSKDLPTEPIYVLDGNVISKDQLKKVSSFVRVLKGPEALAIYGAQARYGVIFLTEHMDWGKTPLILLSGKEISSDDFLKLDQNEIEKTNILKGKEATDKYGEKAENGVIELTAKNKKDHFYLCQCSGKDKNTKKPIVFLDGQEITQDQLDKLSPKNIESFKILKDNEATDKYGERAKYGVIEITIKK
ncbi:hypothetical protein MWN41_05815 [Ornithobacterium rhinotracheale]|uniref:hypothetical protein n=1 Tax=Ornithobacterium rhinotracheale TaxID=28251 RepID=UPI001FF5807F|nr:hypothetical protein [Ornithobacterium rhinotracheale]MCK0202533.1 hypothetical protein [Ornithobacterium rhinotracheale]